MPKLPEGRYKVITTAADVVRKGANNLYAIALAFEATEEKRPSGEYEPVAPGYTIWSNQFIQKKDGTLADAKIKTLSNVYEWDGDLTTVNQFVGKRARITVKNDGKYTDVSWINHIDEGDDAPATFDADTARAAQAALGKNIRALGLRKPAAASTTPTPTAPAPPAPPAAPQATDALPGTEAPPATEETVWAAFVDHMKAKGELESEHAKQWFQFLREHGFDVASAVRDWSALAKAVANYEPMPF